MSQMPDDSVPRTSAIVVRLFIGNLVKNISDDALIASLSKFGTVSRFTRNQDRNFAHLDLVSEDEKSLEKCISVLNQTRWMGTVLRVETAKEHYTDRLKREWSEELDVLPTSSGTLEPVRLDNRNLKCSFSWTGKRITFVDDNCAYGVSQRKTEIREEIADANENEFIVSSSLPDTGKAAVTLELFGPQSSSNPAASNVMETRGEVATVDLFGLNYECDEQEPRIETQPSEKHSQSKCSEESSRADRDAMNEIGNDPSKIDVSEEHDRARAIMAEMFGNNCQSNEVSKSATILFKRKSYYAQFMSLKIARKGANTRPPTSPQPLKLCMPSFSVFSELSACPHRRKALYCNFRSLPTT